LGGTALNKTWLRKVAIVTQVIFMHGTLLPAYAQTHSAIPSHADMRLISDIYSLSLQSLEKHRDPNRFLWALEELIDEEATVNFSLAMAYRSRAMPKVDMSEDAQAFVVNVSKTKRFEVRVKDVDKGEFEIAGRAFKWDETRPMAFNAKVISEILSEEGYQARSGESIYKMIWGSLISFAHAGGPTPDLFAPHPPDQRESAKQKCQEKKCNLGFWIGIGVAALAATLVIYMIKRSKKNKKKRESITANIKKAKKKKASKSKKESSESGAPFHDWKDAKDGLQDSLETDGGVVDEGSSGSHGSSGPPAGLPDGVEWIE
jgi:hypothetical protein